MTLRDIRKMVSDAVRETSIGSATGDTYYPALWAYGEGAGDAMTSGLGDCRLEVAADYVAAELGLNMPGEFIDLTVARDAAALIAQRLRERADVDA